MSTGVCAIRPRSPWSQECYAASDGGAAFAAVLEERGLWLARGDRRGHVALHHSGEAFALSRILDQKAKEVTAKLGPAEAWPGLQERRADIAAAMGPAFERMMADARADPVRRTAPLDAERPRLTEHHRGERERLDLIHADRMQSEDAERSARLKRGLFCVWRWFTGQRGKIIARNTDEKAAAEARDRAERQALLDRRIEPREALQNESARSRERLAEELKALRRDRRDIEAGANRTRDQQQGRTDRGPREIEPS